MKRARFIGILTLALLAVATAGSLADDAATVKLRWALGAWDAGEAAPKRIQKDVQLDTGAKLQFLVEPLSACSVYLLLLDSSDALYVLYRESAKKGSGDERNLIPPGSGRFQLDDDAGRETFFLLASHEPLDKLEGLIESHDAASDSAKPAIVESVVAEIVRLNREHRRLSRPIEKPVMIGGQTRGGPDGRSAIDQLAVEVTAETYYGKTITIEH
ncbi:MAG: DUF4384 domain-containing protein [bacterium]|nr:DUF4384 domain-containing protein [bacterium]